MHTHTLALFNDHAFIVIFFTLLLCYFPCAIHTAYFEFLNMCAAAKFAPDITIISAGFDAARGDPLGCCDVSFS
jgi:hypothetical protein